MGINYAALQTRFAALIQANGQAITFSYSAGATNNVATGAETGGSPTNVEGFGVLAGYKNDEIDGQTIEQGDAKLICNHVGTKPEPEWQVTVNSEVWRVMSVRPINPAGTNIIYICQLRK